MQQMSRRDYFIAAALSSLASIDATGRVVRAIDDKARIDAKAAIRWADAVLDLLAKEKHADEG